MLTMSLVSCIKTMDDFVDNLGKEYETDNLTSKEFEEYAEGFGLDPDDYDVEDMVIATNKKTACSVVIIECGSWKDAKRLVGDSDDIIDELEEAYSSKYTFEAVNKGRFVFIGESDAIDDAIDD